jgi:hypothetical protein
MARGARPRRRDIFPIGFTSGVTYSAEATAFFARLGTPPTDARKAQYDTLISALVAGGVWAKLDILYVTAAASSATALTNLKQSAYPASFYVNTAAFTVDQGFMGAAGTRVTTGFIPSTAGGNFALNSASIGAWTTTAGLNAGALVGQRSTPTSSRAFIYPRTGGNTLTWVNSNGGNSIAAASSAGFWVASRTASNLTTTYKDGVSLGTNAQPSGALPDKFTEFLTDQGTDFLGTWLAGFVGSGLSGAEVTTTYNALRAYLQPVAGVP